MSCPHPEKRRPGRRYCLKCAAAYMRQWRARKRERRLHAVVERRISRETDISEVPA